MKTKSIQSLGGKARAVSLTAEQRTEIAKDAAAVRWNIPRATHQGQLKLGDYLLNCAVLDNNTRVFSERSIAKALGVRGGGAYWKRKKQGGANLPEYISATYLQKHLGEELAIKLRDPIRYLAVSKVESHGIEATILEEICDFWIKLQISGALEPQHEEIARRAYSLMRGYAKVGIIALVDEATGFQEVRDRIALRAILDKYITDEWAKWTKTFPDEFYQELFRLKGIPFPPNAGSKRPSYVGHWTNDIVYSRLAPGVLAELRKLNPVTPSGIRKHKFFQYLTNDIGNPALKEHLTRVIFLMKACGNYAEFERLLNRAAQKYGNTIPMDI